MEPYRVFISSIMNRSIEDLLGEREAVRSAVEHFAPITTPWAFESEPASPKPLLDFYIDAVKSSDLFVLVVGQRVTKPVKDEFDTARDHGKPMLLFAKAASSREPDADQLLHSANVKYDTFINATELREKVRRALGNHLLTQIRGDGEESFGPGDRLAQLRAYSRSYTPVKISPMVPSCQYNSFRVKNVESGVVTFEKDSNRQSFTVPAQRIEDILGAAPQEPPTVLLNGRLQWITLPEIWRFFPEKPAPSDALGLGFGKERPRGDPGLPPQLQSLCAWSLPANLAARLRDGYSVFYDEDGKHLCSTGQILLVPPGVR
jgi:hypothetical protein